MSENLILFIVLGVLSLVVTVLFGITLAVFKNSRDAEIARVQADASRRIAEVEGTAILPIEVGLLMPNAKRLHNGVEFDLTLHGTVHHLRLTTKLEEQMNRLGGMTWKKVSWEDFLAFCEAFYLESQSQVPTPVAQTTVHAPNGATAVVASRRKMKFHECQTNIGKTTYTQAEVDGLEIHNQFKWVSVGPDTYSIEHI